MGHIVESLQDREVLAAIEGNFAEGIASFGRGFPGASFHQDEELTWFLSGSVGPNSILLTHFKHDTQAYIDYRIQDTLKYFEEKQVTEVIWRIGPTTYPPDLAGYLEEHGLTYSTTTVCMALDVTNERIPSSPPHGLNIREVLSDKELRMKCALEKVGFGSNNTAAQYYYQTYARNGFGPDANWHHYIGWLNNQAVACATMLFHQGVASIHGVTTILPARHRGIGTALVNYVLCEAEHAGYRIVALSPTNLSEAIYRRFGFNDFCQLHSYKLSLAPKTHE
ncbi:GNAT family N-acetyltransferase [Dictyobacter arantiisoli]|uniref:N-acetyltransferase domain-containing protein n=1 Tax=Dictyobacter arantiisoli TaxID=2014874 RepID=A0A5A5T7V3_9CHLR|nr:GNAT family N-acetyltransferase [Dictyobacter arantiisoli]GCF07093.1 hypothetical protein KDI_06570 [Dictyobacter arantiisoli]